MAKAPPGHYRPVHVRSVWLGMGLGLLGLASCGRTGGLAPNEACADEGCAGTGGDGQGGASPQECEGDECPICVVGERFCQEGDVFACTLGGKSLNAVELCPTGTVCDPETVSCVAQLCQPEAKACDGTRVGRCNALGTRVVSGDVDCADEDKQCIDGQCVVCVPNDRRCSGDTLLVCDADGQGYVSEQQCSPAYHCEVVPPGVATCLVDTCSAGQTVCVGNTIKTCSEFGGWEAGGVECAPYETCVDAACLAEQCAPQARVCAGDGVYECSDAGIAEIEVEVCSAEETCLEGGGSAHCTRKWCEPGQKTCIDDVVGQCTADGLGLIPETDCRGSGLLCVGLWCDSMALDQNGISDNCEDVKPGADGHVAIGNSFAVTAPRRVLEFSAEMKLAEPTELRWVVGSNPLGGVFMLSEVATTLDGPGSRFFHSGAVDIALVPGQTYFIGVAIAGDASVCYDSTPPPRMPFGLQGGSHRGDATTAEPYDLDRTFTFSFSTVP